jgi:hypothetical protein
MQGGEPTGITRCSTANNQRKAHDPLDLLRNHEDQLFAILDAAQDRRICGLLRDYAGECQSLYEGKSAEELADYAPYLVRLPHEPELLELLLRDGWGKNWGVYLTCDSSFAELRKHLRQFLMVEIDGRTVYFRFYDPRVLRMFLPGAMPDQTTLFFGPIRMYFAEGENPETVFTFTIDRGRIVEQGYTF